MAERIQKIIGPRGVSYLVRVEYPLDPITGKRRQRSKAFRTKKEAEKALAEWLVEIERGTAIDGAKMTVGEYLNHWLVTIARHRVRETTFAAYRTTIRTHIIPAIGSVPLQRLTPAAVQEFYAHMLASGHSAAVVQKCHLRLSQGLKQAARWQMVSRNICESVEPPRVVHKQAQAWTRDELRRFLTESEHDGYHPYWLLAIATGMRRGELLGLRWQDVDMDHGRLAVRQSVTIGAHGAPIFQEPKTPKARRTITVPAEVIAALREHKRSQNVRRLTIGQAWRDNDLVFSVADGGPINPTNLRRNLIAIATRADVPLLNIHALRHSHSTMLLEAGENPKVIQERLGHADIRTTLGIYSHVLPSMQERAAEMVGVLLFGEVEREREVIVK
jgi:integrase